jgi:hypothetical protein
MSKKHEPNPLYRNRENDDGNIEGNEATIHEAISSLRTLVSGESEIILFINSLEILVL